MPTSVGPNTYGEENLVFGYDLGDVSNSYKGEPTTNIATLDLSNTSKWYSEGGTKVLQSETLDGYPVYQFRSSGSLIYISPIASNQVAATTNDVTLSAYFKNTGASTQTVNVFLANDFSTDSNGDPNNRSIPADGKWYRQSWTRYAAANTYNQVEFRTFSDTLLISKPQVEYKKHVTPPVEGTRSVSGSLIDLTGNSTIDLTNVSFDSNAQVDYDGSSDYINLGSSLNSIGSNATFEMVFKAEETNDNYRVMLGWGYGNSNYSGIHIGSWTSGYTDESFHVSFNSGALILYVRKGHTFYKDNTYHHAVVTAGPGNYAIWIDGIEQTLTYGGGNQSTTFDNIIGYNENIVAEIGRRPYGSGTGYFNGKLPLMKIYDRILTASEIKANYNALKGRFNI